MVEDTLINFLVAQVRVLVKNHLDKPSNGPDEELAFLLETPYKRDTISHPFSISHILICLVCILLSDA